MKVTHITWSSEREKMHVEAMQPALLLSAVLEAPNRKIVYVTPNNSTARIALGEFVAFLIECGRKFTVNAITMTVYLDTSSVTFKSAATPDHLRGLRFNHIYVDELAWSHELGEVLRPGLVTHEEDSCGA